MCLSPVEMFCRYTGSSHKILSIYVLVKAFAKRMATAVTSIFRQVEGGFKSVPHFSSTPALMSLVNLMLPAIASFCRSLPRGTLLLNLSSRYARWFRLGFPGVSVQIPQPDLNQISYNWGKTWPIPLFLLHWV